MKAASAKRAARKYAVARTASTTGQDLLRMLSKNRAAMLVLVVVLVNLATKSAILAKLPNDTIAFWLDSYYHIGVSQVVIDTGYIPDNDPFWLKEGVPHVYPDGYTAPLVLMRLIGGITGETASNALMVLSSTLALVVVYITCRRIFGNDTIPFFVAMIMMFIPASFEYSSLPIPNTMAVFFMALMVYMGVKDYSGPGEEGRRVRWADVLSAGLLGGALVILHPMTFEVFFGVAVMSSCLTLVLGSDARRKTTFWLAVLALSFLLSSMWWFQLHTAGLKNLAVSEKDEFQTLEHFGWYMSVTLAIVPVGLAVGLAKYRQVSLVMLAWIAVSLVFILNHNINDLVYSKMSFGPFDFVKTMLMPNWGQRFFAYVTEPAAVSCGFVLDWLYRRRDALQNAAVLRLVPPWLPRLWDHAAHIAFAAIIAALLYSVYVSPPWFMKMIGDTWVTHSEIEAIRALKASGVMPRDSVLDGDFPFDEAYFGITGLSSTISPQLRSSVPLVPYLNDYLGIYFSDDMDAVRDIAGRYGITHVVLSDRIRKSGHFALSESSVWPYTLSEGLRNASLAKFENEAYFRKVFEYKDVEFFCIQPC